MFTIWSGGLISNWVIQPTCQIAIILALRPILMFIPALCMFQHFCRSILHFCLCFSENLLQLIQAKPSNLAQIFRTAYAQNFLCMLSPILLRLADSNQCIQCSQQVNIPLKLRAVVNIYTTQVPLLAKTSLLINTTKCLAK